MRIIRMTSKDQLKELETVAYPEGGGVGGFKPPPFAMKPFFTAVRLLLLNIIIYL